jgi:hypothetical protein
MPGARFFIIALSTLYSEDEMRRPTPLRYAVPCVGLQKPYTGSNAQEGGSAHHGS